MFLLRASVVTLAILQLGLTPAQACLCQPEHPQASFCRSDFAVKAVVERQEIKGGDFTTEFGTFSIQPQRIYHIRVLQTFKHGNSSMTQGKAARITTAVSDNMCGATLKRGGTYLITGSTFDGNNYVSICNWYAEWRTITPKQYKGLLSLYDFNCQCQIEECESSNCRTGQPYYQNRCYWPTTQPPLSDCLAQNSVCTKTDGGSCVWSRGRSRSDCERSNASKRKVLRSSEMLP